MQIENTGQVCPGGEEKIEKERDRRERESKRERERERERAHAWGGEREGERDSKPTNPNSHVGEDDKPERRWHVLTT